MGVSEDGLSQVPAELHLNENYIFLFLRVLIKSHQTLALGIILGKLNLACWVRVTDATFVLCSPQRGFERPLCLFEDYEDLGLR